MILRNLNVFLSAYFSVDDRCTHSSSLRKAYIVMTSLGTLQKGNTKTLNERKNIQIPLHTRRKQTTKALMIIFKSLILIKWSFICIQIIWKFGVLSVMILINNNLELQ